MFGIYPNYLSNNKILSRSKIVSSKKYNRNMAKKSSKANVSKKKSTIPSMGSMNFGPVNFETSNAATAVHLLESAEESLVLNTLLHLTQFSDVNESFLEVLCDNGVYNKLIHLLASDNLAILRLSLRLLINILTKTKYADLILIDEAKAVAQLLISIYVNKNDEILIEYAANIIVKIINLYEEVVPYIYDKKLIEAIFLNLKIKTDPDIQLNGIELLNSLIESVEHIADMLTVPTFQANIFICYLKSTFMEIRLATMSLLKRICQFRYNPLNTHMVHNKVPEGLVQMLMNDEFWKIRDDIMETLILLMETLENCMFFSDSVEFSMIVSWAKFCPEEYIEKYSILIKNFTRFEVGDWRQKLHYYGFEDAVLTLFRTEKKAALLEVCKAVINLSNHKFGCDKMITPQTIHRIIYILNNKLINLQPNKEVALNTIHILLKRNNRMMDILFEQNGLDPIIDFLINEQQSMSEEAYSSVIDIVQIYSIHPHYRSSVMSSKVYETFFNIYDLKEDEFAVKAAFILHEFIIDKDCRKYFLELDGARVVVNKLQTNNEVLFKNTLILIKTAIVYKEIARTLMVNGIIPALRKYQKDYIAATLIIDMISGLHLPFKFYETNRLEITDVIRDNFYLITGHWSESFPFLEQLVNRQLSTKLTIYVVDFTYIKRVRDNPEYNKAAAVPLTTKFSNVNVNYGKLTEDPYLYLYLKELRCLLENTTTIEEKIEVVAKFVQQQLCGTEEDDPVKRRHMFHTHLSFLKTRLGTNMIPIGFMRQGSYRERALLLKVCADHFNLPVTLCRGERDIYYNEAVFAKTDDKLGPGLLYYVIDLMRNPGKLYILGDYMATRYCEGDLNLV